MCKYEKLSDSPSVLISLSKVTMDASSPSLLSSPDVSLYCSHHPWLRHEGSVKTMAFCSFLHILLWPLYLTVVNMLCSQILLQGKDPIPLHMSEALCF